MKKNSAFWCVILVLMMALLLSACSDDRVPSGSLSVGDETDSTADRPEPTDDPEPTNDPTNDLDPTDDPDPTPAITQITLSAAQDVQVTMGERLTLTVEDTAAGWYTLGTGITLDGYGAEKYDLVYLAADDYEVLAADGAQAELTLTPAQAPDGYSPDTAWNAGTEKVLYSGGKLYFTYTAEKNGTYIISFAMLATTDSCRFTLDGEAYYGLGYEDQSVYVKLEAAQSLCICVDSQWGVAGKVGLTVDRAMEEPLPENGWVSGTYINGSITLVLDRDQKTVTYLSIEEPIRFYYLDGQASFATDMGTVNLRMNENGVDLDLWETGSEKVYTLTYRVPVEPVPVDKFEGVYESAEGDRLTIAADGGGIGFLSRYSIGDGGCKYDTQWNELTWTPYVITIGSVDADGTILTLVVTDGESSAVYNAISHGKVTLPSEKLPLTADETVTYAGADTGFTLEVYESGRQTINGRGYTILEADADNTVFKVCGYFVCQIDADGEENWTQETWELVIGDGRILLYDGNGTLQDVLERVLINVQIGELPVSADAVTVERSQINEDGYYFIRVMTSGYYTFVEANSSVTVYRNCTEVIGGYPVFDYGNSVRVSGGGKTLYLEAGELLGFQGGGAEGNRTLTVSYLAKLPQGYAAENPFLMEESVIDLSWNVSSDLLYVSYTAQNGGSYTIGFNNRFVAFTVNGKTYGYDYDNFGNYAAGTTCTLRLEAGESVLIELKRHFNDGETFVLGVAPAGTSLEALFTVDTGEEDEDPEGTVRVGPIESYSHKRWTSTVGGTYAVSGTTGTIEVYTATAWNSYGDPFAKFTGSGKITLVEGQTYYFSNQSSKDVTLKLVPAEGGADPDDPGESIVLGNVCAPIAGTYATADENVLFIWDGENGRYSNGNTTQPNIVPETVDGVLTFSYDRGNVTVTVTFYDSGHVVINDSAKGKFTLTLEQ